MSIAAYHNEALRKARVLERKKDAEMRMKLTQMDLSAVNGHRITTNQATGPAAAEFKRSACTTAAALVSQKTTMDLNRDRVYEVMHPDDTSTWEVGPYLGSGFDADNDFAVGRHYTHQNVQSEALEFDPSRNSSINPHSWQAVQKDLKKREKVLRDHNLVMGPLSAFQEGH